ncbi:hypothetical protein O181_101729 [Austropuccinia psidii MF-1]|uniref:Uncharacterized protein n=1 Tax=Austropuccinia psidii MF-1 TaxID=1389203 RepID=A0A9Q3JHS2_9BASI|nr:hypothetical protein [Austropuccinia psidii MF-1]
MTYSKKEALKQLPDAPSSPEFSGTGKYDHMELIYYIDGLFIDFQIITYYWITAIPNTKFKRHSSICYTEMKGMHGRRNWPCLKSNIIQKHSNGTWIWQIIMSFNNEKYSVDQNTYDWCLKQSKRTKNIAPHMNIQMRNHKRLTQIPRELEHAVKFG